MTSALDRIKSITFLLYFVSYCFIEKIAGFVLEISGSFPKLGSKINFDNYVFIIESLDKKRIKQVKVTLPN